MLLLSRLSQGALVGIFLIRSTSVICLFIRDAGEEPHLRVSRGGVFPGNKLVYTRSADLRVLPGLVSEEISLIPRCGILSRQIWAGEVGPVHRSQ